MATITSLNAGDSGATSRGVINTNLTNLNTDKIETSVLDTDVALTANSDAKIATQKAVKAYVDGGGGTANASDTVKGLVEEATEAETLAGTAVGGTGARLYVSPSTLDSFNDTYIAAVSAPVVRTYLNAGSPHTWTKPTGLKYVVVEVLGGGGGGDGTTGDSYGDAGSAGGYSKKLIGTGSLGATETVTVGAAGSGGAPSGETAGGTSSFGSHASATGGAAAAGAGGSGSGGDINVTGQTGGEGTGNAGTSGGIIAQYGGSSIYGAGGKTPTSGNGGSATGYGAGGGGGSSTNSSDFNGGNGSAGIVIVTEYYI